MFIGIQTHNKASPPLALDRKLGGRLGGPGMPGGAQGEGHLLKVGVGGALGILGLESPCAEGDQKPGTCEGKDQ